MTKIHIQTQHKVDALEGKRENLLQQTQWEHAQLCIKIEIRRQRSTRYQNSRFSKVRLSLKASNVIKRFPLLIKFMNAACSFVLVSWLYDSWTKLR